MSEKSQTSKDTTLKNSNMFIEKIGGLSQYILLMIKSLLQCKETPFTVQMSYSVGGDINTFTLTHSPLQDTPVIVSESLVNGSSVEDDNGDENERVTMPSLSENLLRGEAKGYMRHRNHQHRKRHKRDSGDHHGDMSPKNVLQ
jgi:hypothetical protein